MGVDAGDEALVLAACGGDKDAFACLIDRHWPLLLSLCRRMLGHLALAEDAAQEAALQAMLSLNRLESPERFGPWLAGIGLNVCRQWLRQQSHERWSLEDLLGGVRVDEPIEPRDDPAEIAEAADLAKRVRFAVDGLPRGQRAAVLLFYLSGLTYAETAAMLGVGVGAVRTRLHKARETLKRQLWILWMEETMATAKESPLVEMRISDIGQYTLKAEANQTPVDVAESAASVRGGPTRHIVVLDEVAGTRRLHIWIGQTEAQALAMQLQNVQAPRPQTHTFTASVLQAVGGRLREVRISRLADNIFYAEAVVDGPDGSVTVDARPSDALNLALITGAPILVAPNVIEAAIAHLPDDSSVGQRENAAEIAARAIADWKRNFPAPKSP